MSWNKRQLTRTKTFWRKRRNRCPFIFSWGEIQNLLVVLKILLLILTFWCLRRLSTTLTNNSTNTNTCPTAGDWRDHWKGPASICPSKQNNFRINKRGLGFLFMIRCKLGIKTGLYWIKSNLMRQLNYCEKSLLATLQSSSWLIDPLWQPAYTESYL